MNAHQQVYDEYTDRMGTTIQFPHCDSLILHSPGVCEFCDRHPDWQQARTAFGIAFSDDPAEIAREHDLIPCPSTVRRTAEVRDRWPGNTPKSDDIMPTMAEDYTMSDDYWRANARVATIINNAYSPARPTALRIIYAAFGILAVLAVVGFWTFSLIAATSPHATADPTNIQKDAAMWALICSAGLVSFGIWLIELSTEADR